MDIEVDEMGNCWATDDEEKKFPVMPHPELEAGKARCPCAASEYVFRVKLGNDRFEWRCGCGKTFPGLHH